MEQKSQSMLPKILNAFGTFAILITIPVGFFYTLHGDKILTVIFTLLAAGILVTLSQYLFKEKRKKSVTERSKSKEYMLLAAYIGVALVLFPFMFHFISVDFFEKNKLTRIATDKLENIPLLLDKYDKAVEQEFHTFETKASDLAFQYFQAPTDPTKKAAFQKIAGQGSLGLDEYRQNKPETKDPILNNMKNIIAEKKTDIDNKYDLGISKTNAIRFYDEKKSVFTRWKHTEVAQAYYAIDNEVEKLKVAAKGKMPAFQYEQTNIEQMELDSPMKSIENSNFVQILIVFVLILIFHLLLLSEYIQSERSRAILRDKKPGGRSGIQF